MVTYHIKYSHGDADAFTSEKFSIDGVYKNKLVQMILQIFEYDRPEWRDNFLYHIEEGAIEEYLIDNCEDEEDTPEMWDKIEILLREQRAKDFYKVLKQAYLAKEFRPYETEPIQKILDIDFDTIKNKEEFYKKLFDVCFNAVDMYYMLIPDITCEDRFAHIEKIITKEK